jgi:hypothetical protein
MEICRCLVQITGAKMQSASKAWNYIKSNKWKVLGAATTATAGILWWRGRSARSDFAQLQNKQIFWTDSQSTCDQTIVSFAPLVAKTLNDITKIPELLEQLRKPDLDRQTKLELWEQLKVACTLHCGLHLYYWGAAHPIYVSSSVCIHGCFCVFNVHLVCLPKSRCECHQPLPVQIQTAAFPFSYIPSLFVRIPVIFK